MATPQHTIVLSLITALLLIITHPRQSPSLGLHYDVSFTNADAALGLILGLSAYHPPPIGPNLSIMNQSHIVTQCCCCRLPHPITVTAFQVTSKATHSRTLTAGSHRPNALLTDSHSCLFVNFVCKHPAK